MVLLTDWQRLEKVIKWTGHAINAFAREIGLNRAENLYQIKNGNNRISRSLADKIVDKYPKIDKGWLLVGGGEMFVSEDEKNISVPFYDADAEKYISSPGSFKSRHRISLPMLEETDFATMYYGRAMGDEIPQGAIVFFKKVALCCLVPGGDYLVVTDNVALLRRVRRNIEGGQLRLLPLDTRNFDEIRIDEGQVTGLYVVRAVLINRSV
jgi:hypothetical protein